MAQILKNDWADFLNPEFDKPYYRKLRAYLIKEYRSRKIFPDKHDIFNALHQTAVKDIKALILGQDPYHDDGQAHGLAFSVAKGIAVPPSLVNIYKELNADIGCAIPNHGHLVKWTAQGVLLLNTVLTVRAHQAHSHRGIGWETFTDAVIGVVNQIDRPIAILLWGRPAQQKRVLLNNPKHLILETSHPSPLSAYRGFEGCRHFSKVNRFLVANGVEPIDWQID